MPWDKLQENTSTTGESPTITDTPKGTASSAEDKYGTGKPFRIFIVGDIKK